MTNVVLIRPGATDYDDQDRVQGVLDLPLSPRGQTEVVRLTAALAEIEFVALYCGPSENVLRTAEAIGRAAGVRPKRIDDLRNLDQGLWQGLQREEIKRRHGKVFRQWLDEPCTVCPPQGEMIEDALDRVRGVLKPILRRHREGAIGLILAEPMAQLVGHLLRRSARLQFLEEVRGGGFERIDLNGDGSRIMDAPPTPSGLP